MPVAEVIQRLTLILILYGIHLENVQIPEFSSNFFSMNVQNVSCTIIDIRDVNISITESSLDAKSLSPTYLTCKANVQIGAYSGELYADITVNKSTVILQQYTEEGTTDNTEKSTANAWKQECVFTPRLSRLAVVPEDVFFSAVLRFVRKAVESIAHQYVCGVAIRWLQQAYNNRLVILPAPIPKLEPAAIPLRDAAIFRAAHNIVDQISISPDIIIDMKFKGDTTLGLTVRIVKPLNISHLWTANKDKPCPMKGETECIHSTCLTLKTNHVATWLCHILNVLPDKNTFIGSLDVSLPSGTVLNVDVVFRDLRCEYNGAECTIPYANGIQISNIRFEGIEAIGRIATNNIGPAIAQIANSYIQKLSQPTKQDGRWRITPAYTSPKNNNYRLISAALYATSGLIVTLVILKRTIQLQKTNPVLCILTNEAISTTRVGLEDFFLCFGLLLCGGGLLWSNCSDAAHVIIGKELSLYSFSLVSTVKDLWLAGLWPLSVCVLIFSGIYPYYKLVNIFVYTIIYQNPNATILRLTDYISKFSLIDIFVLPIMVAGLQVQGIADVQICASFYIFMLSTAGTIAMGNYASHVWRHNTTIRITRNINEPSIVNTDIACPCNSNTTHYIHKIYIHTKNAVEQNCLHYTGLPISFVCLVCSVFVWLSPCVIIKVGGAANIVTPQYKPLTLSDLAMSTGWMTFALTAFTIILAPCLYCTNFSSLSFLSSWCAADAFLLACTAGLLQLDQFIVFILGKQLTPLYYARADLCWPLILLSIAAITVWGHICIHETQ